MRGYDPCYTTFAGPVRYELRTFKTQVRCSYRIWCRKSDWVLKAVSLRALLGAFTCDHVPSEHSMPGLYWCRGEMTKAIGVVCSWFDPKLKATQTPPPVPAPSFAHSRRGLYRLASLVTSLIISCQARSTLLDTEIIHACESNVSEQDSREW